MKKVLILGGGDNQLSLIKSAREAGIQVILCDINENAVGVPIANQFYKISILDREAVLDVAKKESVNGVVANTEAAMQLVAYICDTLGLPGNAEESVQKLVSKKEFRQLQKSQGLFAPDFAEISSFSSLQDVLSAVKLPAVIKPSESSGTRGTAVIRADTPSEELKKAYEICRDFSRNDLVTIESFINMPSLTVVEGDLFLNHGEIMWDGLFFTRRSPAAPMIPMTYVFPLTLMEEQYKYLQQSLATALHAAGIRHGQYNAEMYFTESGELFIVEINARQGGNKIPLAIKLHTGIDMDKLLVTTAVGDDSYWNELKTYIRPKRFTAWHLVFPRNAGILKEMRISEQIKDHVIYTEMFHKPGDVLQNTENASSCMGYVGLQFDSSDQMWSSMGHLEDLICPIIV